MRPLAANQHPQDPFNQRLKSRLDCLGVTYRMSFTSNSISPRPPPRLRTNLRTSTLVFPKFTRSQTKLVGHSIAAADDLFCERIVDGHGIPSKPFLLNLAADERDLWDTAS